MKTADQTRSPLGFEVFRVGELAWIVCPYCNVRLLVDVCSPARSLCVENMLDQMLGEHVNTWCTGELADTPYRKDRRMAERITRQLIDDLDGSDATEQVVFALDGTQYEIDLAAGNAETLRAKLAPYTTAGRKLGKVGTGQRRTRSTSSTSSTGKRSNTAEIREWARNNGYDTLKDRGRIPEHVQAAYDAAHATSSTGSTSSTGKRRKSKTASPSDESQAVPA